MTFKELYEALAALKPDMYFSLQFEIVHSSRGEARNDRWVMIFCPKGMSDATLLEGKTPESILAQYRGWLTPSSPDASLIAASTLPEVTR